jgi:hypothetical protein
LRNKVLRRSLHQALEDVKFNQSNPTLTHAPDPTPTLTPTSTPAPLATLKPNAAHDINSSADSDATPSLPDSTASDKVLDAPVPACIAAAYAYSSEELSKMKEAANMMIAVNSGPDSVHERMESLRMLLEDRLGEQLFCSAHRAIDGLQRGEEADDEVTLEAVKISLGPQWMYFPLIIQLVNCENSLVSFH